MAVLTWFRSLFDRPTATTRIPSSPAMHYATAYLGEARVRRMLAEAEAERVRDESSHAPRDPSVRSLRLVEP